MISKFIIALIIIALLMVIILMGRLFYKYHLYPRMTRDRIRDIAQGVLVALGVFAFYCAGNLFYGNVIYKPSPPLYPYPGTWEEWKATHTYPGVNETNMVIDYKSAVRYYDLEVQHYNDELNTPYLNPFIPRQH